MEKSYLGPNAALIGQPGSRDLLATPCLVLDRVALARNIASAAAFCRAHEIKLRPHAKSHKCAAIAYLQMKAGAVGLCVATVGEAETFAHAGITDLLITSTFTQPNKFARAVALAARGYRITLVADDPEMVGQIAAHAAQQSVVIDVLVDVDLGRHRNGVTSAERAVAVAQRIAASPALRLAGIQAYASHISHLPTYAERLAASQSCARFIEQIRAALAAAGFPLTHVTGGSTGTLFMDPGLDCYSELQCGSYVFNDAEYRALDLDDNKAHIEEASPFAASLFVKVSVIGRNVPGRVTCDGGNKHFSAKGTLPAFLTPPVEGAVYRPDSDEHGIIELPKGAPQPALGSQFELIVPHCDPTVNLYDHFHVVEGDRLVDIWPIEARGAF
jgi:D-serine deaminase-like pyridoxal phosphate-dependent protein